MSTQCCRSKWAAPINHRCTTGKENGHSSNPCHKWVPCQRGRHKVGVWRKYGQVIFFGGLLSRIRVSAIWTQEYTDWYICILTLLLLLVVVGPLDIPCQWAEAILPTRVNQMSTAWAEIRLAYMWFTKYAVYLPLYEDLTHQVYQFTVPTCWGSSRPSISSADWRVSKRLE